MSKHPLIAWLLVPIIFFLVACTVIRLCLLGLYADFFATLSAHQIMQAFMQGMRFDLSISAVAYAPFLLALLVVMFFHKGRWLTASILWAAFVVQVALWGLCVANLGYFGEVYRPLGDEVLMLVNDVDFVITLMTGSRWLLVVFALGALGLIAWMWSKTILPRARAV